MSAVLREMTPLTWALFGILFVTAVLLLGCVVVGAVLWVRGFHATTDTDGATFDVHAEQALHVARSERAR